MARTEYIAAATAVTVGESFTLTAGESRRFYASPALQKGERVEFQRKSHDGWASQGYRLSASGVEAGLLYNEFDSTQTYRLIKGKTRDNTAIEYDA